MAPLHCAKGLAVPQGKGEAARAVSRHHGIELVHECRRRLRQVQIVLVKIVLVKIVPVQIVPWSRPSCQGRGRVQRRRSRRRELLQAMLSSHRGNWLHMCLRLRSLALSLPVSPARGVGKLLR
eukprot:TRINITY_DN5284_c0_g2_i2.p4 TRINITY_DN5284_c0_g2~~TRINITY_DN5284_c0_g2_i2.p4  ORF type:complete len:123 (+),score=2.70 TRINITY_DN5284_c0_g2_i2:623-991(+)